VTPSSLYNARQRTNAIAEDPSQRAILAKLDTLHAALLNTHKKPGFLRRLLAGKNHAQIRGLYIHGEVGRGKTMLMDLFYGSIESTSKRRVHFHAFMQEIHARRASLKDEDIISRIADDIARDCTLLCLDEMQIVDIADAMIIGRLFEALQQRGVCFVTTSNLPPEDLYKDGLNRQLFLPFIAKLRESLDVVSLDSPTDYRLGRIAARETFLHPPTAENRVAFNALWNDLTDSAAGNSETLEVLGRKLIIPKAAHGCAAFTFFELCSEALGPPDYLAIAKAYRTVFISGVPRLKAHQRNETKRFILMIDTFYDAGTRLVALAEDAPAALFPKNQHAFESKRAVSRLEEMQAASWWVDSTKA
jgi:cell division protein ZapE